MTTETHAVLEQYRYVIRHILDHISDCNPCSCKFIDVISRLDLNDNKKVVCLPNTPVMRTPQKQNGGMDSAICS